MARKRPPSRPARWAAACEACRAALAAMEAAKDDMATALDELRSVREEYEEWKDNLPENLQGSTLYDKLEEVCGLDIPDDPGDSTYSDLEEVVDNAEGVDLPLGFGRD